MSSLSVAVSFLLAFLLTLPAAAQRPLSRRVLEFPYKYNKPKYESDFTVASAEGRLGGTAWIVYSDRDNNRTYTRPGGSQELARLGYMDKFYVVGEEDDWIRLAIDPQKPKGLNLSSAARDYGWIEKAKLLVWRHCLVTEVGEIARKAMILNTVEHLKNLYSDAVEPDIVRFRSAPDPKVSATGHTSHLFEFFFVYKTEGDYVLLGKQVGVSRNDELRRSSMVGWAPRDRMTFWDSRVAVEPNWEDGAVEERRVGLRAKFFADRGAAQDYRNGEDPQLQEVLWDTDPLGGRPIGAWRRFPVLEWDVGEQLLKVGVMGRILGVTAGDIDALFEARSRDRVGRQLKKVRRINIVFVVDGTTSMIPYFRSMAEGVRRSMESLQRQHTQNEFRFGAVVYRDYAEGDRLIESLPLAPNAENVIRFLNRIDEGDKFDRDKPEAVFYGLYHALRNSGFVPEETNAIVLVGDAGNHHRPDESQISSDLITKALVAYGCHFLAIQVHHDPKYPTYDDFVWQLNMIMIETVREVYALQREHFGAAHVLDPPEWRVRGRHYRLVNGGYGGWILGVPRALSLSQGELIEDIQEFIQHIEMRTNGLIEEIGKIMSGEGEVLRRREDNAAPSSKFETPLAPGILECLRQSGLTRGQLKVAADRKYQLYTLGYAPMIALQQKYPLFKRVLLLSKDELGDITHTLGKLIYASTRSDARRKMVDIWMELLNAYVGGQDPKQAREMSLTELNSKIFGLPGTSRFLSEVRLADILEPDRMSDIQFRQYVKRMHEAYQDLSRISNMDEDDYPYSFRAAEYRYYWIPEDLIP